MFTFLEERTRRLLATLTAVALLAGLSVIGAIAPAQALPTANTVAGGTLTWGVVQDYREAFPNMRTSGDGASFVEDKAVFPAAATSTWDGTTGDLRFTGTVRIGYAAGPSGNYISLTSPRITLDGASGTLSANSVSKSHGQGPEAPAADRQLANLDLADAVKSETDTTVTWTGVKVVLVAEAVAVFPKIVLPSSYESRQAGDRLDDLSITLNKSTTTTAVSASALSTTVGSSVTFVASVAPAGTGTVTFSGGGLAPTSVAVTGGSASFSTAALAAGTHAITATYSGNASAAPSSGTVTLTVSAAEVWTPQIQVFAADGVTPLGTTPVELGDTIVVKGSGFDPLGNPATTVQPPISQRAPAGTYVVFGKFTDNWRPSAEGVSSARFVGSQKWAMSDAAFALVDTKYQGAITSQRAVVGTDGTFQTTLTIQKKVSAGTEVEWPAAGDFGVYTYAANTAVNAAQELKVPVNLAGSVVPTPATETTTVISAAPASVVAGGASSIIATVTPASAAGTVEFYSGEKLVGSAPLSQGVANLTTGALAAGKHAFTARFVPTDATAYAASATTTGVTVTATAAVDGGTVTPPASAAGQLVWGVKASFTNYITSIAAGTIAVSNGAGTSGNAFTFSQASQDFNGSTGTVGYAGAVRFAGHEGALDLKLSNPKIKVTGPTSAVLIVDVVGKGLTGGTVDKLDVEFATLALGASSVANGVTTWSDAAATLTAAGSEAFSGFYPAGTALDPVSFTIGADKKPGETPVEPPVTPVAPLAPGTYANATVNVPTVLPGGEVTVTGSGFGAGTTDIELAVYSVRQVLATGLTADANGTVTATVKLPTNLEAGVHTLSFEAPNGVKSQIAITVESPAAKVKQCVANSVSGASLSWGVKSAFRSYITGPIANGAITTNGVTDSGSTFRWTGGTGKFNTEVNQGRVSFGGSVNFSGHGGILDLTLSNVRIQVTSASTGTLIADVSSTDMAGTKSSQSGVAVASLSLAGTKSTSGSTVTWTNASASLTAAGAKAFAGSYVAGEALDPVTFSFPLGASVECDSTSGALASTGADGLADAVLLALAAVTFGLGLVVVTRRRRTSVRIG